MSESKRILVKGNEALAMGAIKAGCLFYFGYPITPQNEVPEYMSRVLPGLGGQYVQAESELASINMVMGASSLGVRSMTSSSSPGISLMQEGLSYLAGQELPAVVINVVRCGPGLGGIAASQGDYFQAVKGGGHGDYRLIVLAPASVQEMYDHTIAAFHLADRYRNPTMVLADGVLGQMQEPIVECDDVQPEPRKPWALTGAKNRPMRYLKSLYLKDGELEAHNRMLQEKYREIEKHEVRCDELLTEDAELVVAAFGTAARIARTAVSMARDKGLKVGLFRPVTLFPFPKRELKALSERVKKILVVEMNTGQMVEDVRLNVSREADVSFYGRPGGGIPTPNEILEKIEDSFS
ncbi:MAG: 3-methyl-2-oxobutanoate dehydrogenase subunit VorB [bacterium]|nr:3-methyl-2-oxobutanoate dehydrogenase subunit VorB [bacterium]MDT8395799.1 3-methyl-2-oxobutanoate dehydrogenase subunit VorB [bacterium]